MISAEEFDGMAGGYPSSGSWLPPFDDAVDCIGIEEIFNGIGGLPVAAMGDFSVPRLRGVSHDAAGGTGDDEEPSGTVAMEDIAKWRRDVVVDRREVVSKDHEGGRLKSRCFAVEWRSSALVDTEEIVNGLFSLLGGDASFVLGTDARGSRADHMAVVRLKEAGKRIMWRNCREKLMFGHGAEALGETLFLRVLIASSQSAEGTKAFVDEMLRKCNLYEVVYRYDEVGLTRELDRGYSRGGRKKRKVSEGEVSDGLNIGDE